MTMRHTLLASTVWAFLGSTAALAQSSSVTGGASLGVGENDIVVTATRREERLQDVPLAVTALSSETLRTRGIASVGDLGSGRVPGLAVTTMNGTETALALYIRGFGASDASQGTQDLPVALYIDGVNVPRAQGAGMDLVTPERIEVLRGPQGQLFGRNAHSGAVQIVSKRPSGEWQGDFLASLGTFDTVQFKGRLDLPEIAGFKVQISGNFRKHGGYFKNPYNPNYANATFIPDPLSHVKFIDRDFNGDYRQLKTYGGRVAVEKDFGDINFFYSYDNSWSRDDQGANEFRRSDDVGTIFTNFSTTPLSNTITFSNFSGPGGSQVFFSNTELGDKMPSSVPYATPLIGFVTKAQGHILNLTYTASDNLTLRSLTGRRIVTRAGGHVQNAAVSSFLTSSSEYLKSEMFSQELQAIYTTNNFNITAGALYFKEDVLHELGNGLVSNCLNAPAVAGPTCIPGSSQASKGPHSANSWKRSLSKTEAYGLYAQGTYTIGPVDLTAGVRYSNDTKKGARVIDRALGIDNTTGLGVVRRNRFHTSRVDPAFTAKINFNDDINAYVRYAIGYRDGGSSVRSATFSSFNEDEIKSWEIGFKSQLLDRRLTVNAAVFHNTIKGQQTSIQAGLALTPPNVSLTEVINSPVERKIKGIELEITANLLPGLTIAGTYTYLKSDNILFGYDTATLAPFAPAATFTPATGLIPDTATIAAHPNSQILLIGPLGTPKHSGSVNVDYVVPIKDSNVLLHVDWTRSSRFFSASPEITKTNINNGVIARVAGYNEGITANQVNARIAFRDIPLMNQATAEFALWVKNAFNQVDVGYSFVAGINSIVVPQAPRVMGADFRIRF